MGNCALKSAIQGFTPRSGGNSVSGNTLSIKKNGDSHP